MVQHFINFVLGTVVTAGTVSALGTIDPNSFGNPEELIKYIISILGGILATVIISILKKRFPQWFTSQKRSER